MTAHQFDPIAHDWPQDSRYWYCLWSVGSFASCLILYQWISPCISMRKSSKYRQMDSHQRREWDSRMLSFVHALVVSILSIVALTKDTALWSSPIITVSRSGFIALAIAGGYMLCDSFFMVTNQRGLELYLFLIHHIVVALSSYFLLTYRVGAFFGIVRLTSEISTPFLHLRWFLRAIGYDTSHKSVALTTVIFTITFCLSRHVLILPYWYIFLQHYQSPTHLFIAPRLSPLTGLFISAAAVLDVLNLVWGIAVFCLARKTIDAFRFPPTTVNCSLLPDAMSAGTNGYTHGNGDTGVSSKAQGGVQRSHCLS